MPDIFVSYSSTDRDRVAPLVATLEAEGWSVWWDRMIPAGQSWPDVIEARLAESRLGLVVWTRASVESKWVRIEAREAERRTALLPVRLDDVAPPLEFSELQAADLVGWDGGVDDPRVRDVVAQARRMLVREEDAGAVGTDDPVAAGPSRPAAPPPGGDRRRLGRTALAVGAVVLIGALWTTGSLSGPDPDTSPPWVAALPVFGDSGLAAQRQLLDRRLEGALAEDPAWAQTLLAPPALYQAERQLIAEGRVDVLGAVDTTVIPPAPQVVVAARLDPLPPGDSVRLELLAFVAETGTVLGRTASVTGREPRLVYAALAVALDAVMAPPSIGSGEGGRAVDPRALSAMGEGLLDLAAGRLASAATVFSRGSAAAPEYPPLIRAVEGTQDLSDLPRPGVAVLPLAVVYSDSTGTERPEHAATIAGGVAALVSDELLKQGVRMLERMHMDALLREQELGGSGRVDPAAAARVGRIVPVRYTVGGALAVVGEDLDLELQITDLETGRVVESHRASGRTDALFEILQAEAGRLARTLGSLHGLEASRAKALADLLESFGLSGVALRQRGAVPVR
ncbi:MAG: TIR domain-containing protein [Longimicrobiales bacterium]